MGHQARRPELIRKRCTGQYMVRRRLAAAGRNNVASTSLIEPLRYVIAHRRMDQVLRTALVKPAMTSAANAHASSRNTQLPAVSQAVVALAEFVVRSQSTRAHAGAHRQVRIQSYADLLNYCARAARVPSGWFA